MRYAAAALAAITSAVLAGCSTAAPAAAPPSATPAGASSSPASAPPGQHAPGPFKITPVYCGKFSAAQQNQYGTTAAGGFVYRYTNDSNTLQGSADVSVNFTAGSTVAGNNVAGASLPMVGPGQSADGEVDAVGGGGQPLTFSSCQVMSYAVVTPSGTLPQQYAP